MTVSKEKTQAKATCEVGAIREKRRMSFVRMNETFHGTPIGMLIGALSTGNPEKLEAEFESIRTLRMTITSLMAVMSDYQLAESHDFTDGSNDALDVYQLVSSLNEFCLFIEDQPDYWRRVRESNGLVTICGGDGYEQI